MTILEFTGKKKDETYTTWRVKTSDVDRLIAELEAKNIKVAKHDLFTQLVNVYFKSKDRNKR
tara:strand:- start:677 stop:862 length:186 start_codon:yes stop_codon:yes gene_type:complete